MTPAIREALEARDELLTWFEDNTSLPLNRPGYLAAHERIRHADAALASLDVPGEVGEVPSDGQLLDVVRNFRARNQRSPDGCHWNGQLQYKRHWNKTEEECVATLRVLFSTHPTENAPASEGPKEEGELAADEARIWEALNVGQGMAEALALSGDNYSPEDWVHAKEGYGRVLTALRAQLADERKRHEKLVRDFQLEHDAHDSTWLAKKAQIARAEQAESEAKALREALEGLASWKMRDGSLCYCPAGTDEDEPKGKIPTIHSTSCEEARTALASVKDKA